MRSLLVGPLPVLGEVFKGLGLGAMFTESEIILIAVMALARQGIVTLGLHDAIIVKGRGTDK